MNPTSPGIRSLGDIPSPNSSPSAEKPKFDYSPSLEEEGWKAKEGCIFPVYSESENQKFGQIFDQCVKEVSLHLQTMMTCLSENFPDAMTTPWKAFSILVSCLEADLPKQIPLSIFTSAVATRCIANVEASPPEKKKERFRIRQKNLISKTKHLHQHKH